MLIVADTHVHIYPCYDLSLFFRNAFQNLSKVAPTKEASVRVIMLTERYDCHFFEDLRSGKLSCPGYLISQVDPSALRVETNGQALFLFAGRQIVSRERIEILALTLVEDIPDGLPVEEILRKIKEAGGLAVLSWAPGKWFFKRGKKIHGLISKLTCDFMLGDTSLRPTIWPNPCLMRLGNKAGLKIIAGSDPLPFAGEEQYAGRYATTIEAPFNETKPTLSIREALNDAHMGKVSGRRCGLVEVLCRLKKNSASKK